MKRLGGIASAGVALMLAACVTHTPVHYYTLLGAVPAQASAATTASYDIDVLPVSVPRALQRRAMVLRTGDAQLMIQDGHQWAAPLPDEFQVALSADLVARLGTRDVGSRADDGRPVYRVSLAIRRFDAVYNRRVVLEALWSLADARGKPLLTCTATRTRQVGDGYAALARGTQQALAEVAGQIAVALEALPRTTCPPTRQTPSGAGA